MDEEVLPTKIYAKTIFTAGLVVFFTLNLIFDSLAVDKLVISVGKPRRCAVFLLISRVLKLKM